MQRVLGQSALQSADEFLHAANERSEQAAARRTFAVAERAKDAAVLSLRVDESRKERSNRERLDVAGVDAAEQRLGHRGDRRPAKAPAKKRGDGFIARVAAARHERFNRKPRARGRGEQVVARDSSPRYRNAEHRRRRQLMKTAMLEHKRDARFG